MSLDVRLAPPLVSPAMSVPPQVRRPAPPERREAAVIAALRRDVEREAAGAVAGFWRHVERTGTPLVEPLAGTDDVVLTWVWRGGDEVAAITLVANKLVDPTAPATGRLSRVPGTDVWSLGLRVGAAWRGSYALAVVTAGAPPTVDDDELARLELRRTRAIAAADPTDAPALHDWFDALAHCRPDPLAREQLDATTSVAAGPAAPPQPHLGRRSRHERGVVDERRVEADDVGERQLWTYRPPFAGDRELPLVVMLDGEDWIAEGAADTFDNLVADGATAPFAAVLVASRPLLGRVEDLTCNPRFVSFLADAVVPAARRWTGATGPVIVVGQSLGGLTALYAGLARPDVVRGVVAQSGSFWWPNTGDRRTREWLTSVVPVGGAGLDRVYVEVGGQEWALLGPTRRMVAALVDHGVDVRAVEYDGGHDVACWRGSLADALVWMLPPTA